MSGEHAQALARMVGALIDELVRSGAEQFVVCPGSRSTPLALLAARHPLARVWVHLDERSAGFFALGMAKQRQAPVVLICTSGTAAANFLPAVAEAHLSRVPLIVLTADRPPELRDNGAPQTIDQVRLFGPHAKWFAEVALPTADEVATRYARTLAGRAVSSARLAPMGVVQLNCPFREPLLPDSSEVAPLARADSAAYVQVHHGQRELAPEFLERLAGRLAASRKGVILAGPDTPPSLAPLLSELAARLGYPILADPLSGLRCGPHDRGLVLASYDAFLRDEAFVAGHGPELVLRFGAMPTSKPVLLFLQRYPNAHQIVVDSGAGWREPTNLAAELVFAEEHGLCRALIDRLAGQAPPELRPAETRLSRWLRPWLSAERVTREVLEKVLQRDQPLFEGRVFSEVAQLLPAEATLFLANSMPIRDADTFIPSSAKPLRMVGNRGANGIDGLVSTGLGLAAAGATPLTMVLGDLSLFHDSNGLLAAKLHALDATIVLINNDGGGIFSFLPQASERDHFEQLFGTPHGLDFAPLAALYGAHYTHAEDWAQFRTAVEAGVAGKGLHLIEIRTERAANVALHREIWPQVSAALRRLGL